MAILAAAAYDPSTAVSKATSAALAMTAIDTTNLRLSFVCPANGTVTVRLATVLYGAATYPQILLGVLDGATVRGRGAPSGAPSGTALATTYMPVELLVPITGLSSGTSYTWDAAYSVDFPVASTNLKYGGPNNTTASDAWGAFIFEIWATA